MTENEIMKDAEEFVVLEGEERGEDALFADPIQATADAIKRIAESVNTADTNNKEFNNKAIDARLKLAELTCEHPEMKDTLRLYAEDSNSNTASVNDNYNSKNEIIGNIFFWLLIGVCGGGAGYIAYKNPELLQPLFKVSKK